MLHTLSRRLLAASASTMLALAGCGGGEPPAPATPAPAPEAAPAPETAPATPEGQAPPAKIDVEALRNEARTAMFVPAPTEFQAALDASKAGLDIRKLVPAEDRDLTGKKAEILALETGVRVGKLLMTVQGGDKAAINKRMSAAREGLVSLNAPPELLADVDKLLKDYESGVLSTKELGPAMDLLSEKIQDQLNEKLGPTIATLVQAGGWLQGANLLATGLSSKNLTGDSAALLHQPTVLQFFMDFLKNSDPARAGDPDVGAVIQEMEKMALIAAKADLSGDDVKAVAGHTSAILARF